MVRYFFEEISQFAFDRQSLRRVLNSIVKDHGYSVGEINVVFCSDAYLLEMNRNFLQHDYYTDIITFGGSDKDVINGELYISIDRVIENAATYNVIFQKELYRVACHGCLHLVGFGDSTDEEVTIIRAKEDLYINRINNQI